MLEMNCIVEFRNSFHHTIAKCFKNTLQRIEIDYMNNNGKLNSNGKRIWKKLCGIKSCTCGDYLGRRE